MADLAVIPLDHGRHDRLAIAAEADRSVDRGASPGLGRALLAACTECVGLQADLIALAAALPSVATPRRPRDFTLRPRDAERLRPRGWRGWLGRIGTSRDTVTRPLAIGFTTLGIAGLLVATAPTVLPGAIDPSSGGSAAGATATDAIRLEMSPAGSVEPGFQQHVDGGTGTAVEAPVPIAPEPGQAAGDQGVDRLPLVLLSGAFVVVGGGLVGLRRRARVR